MAADLALVLRAARPEDVDRLTELHWQAFGPDEHVPVILGKGYVRAMYRWHIRSQEAILLVAEQEGQIVGLLGACDRPYTWPMFRACFGELLRSLCSDPLLLVDRRLWQRMLRQREPSCKRASRTIRYPRSARVTFAAVDSRYRGRGVFPALVEAIRAASQVRGHRAMLVGVYRSNPASRKAFVKEGWCQVPELATSETVFYTIALDAGDQDEPGPARYHWPAP
jgi:ribosomal protein S18 acetylase RimI-like enzyme